MNGHRNKTNTVLMAVLLAGTVAMVPCAQAQAPPPASAAPSGSSVQTPRTPDGKPDLSGYWGTAAAGGRLGVIGIQAPGVGGQPGDPNDLALAAPLRNGDFSNLSNDRVIARRSGDNLPLYKPEYWDRVLDADLNGNLRDPYNSCMPVGEPRMGPPTRIVQKGNELFFFYAVIVQRNEYRDIPTGPRTHPVDRDGTWLGDPVAHWEGDTLVVVTEGFNDQTWIGPEGYIHSYDLKVTEKFHREGDTLTYDVTVEDPEMLQRPWVLDTCDLKLNPDPNFRIEEAPPCSERDNSHLQGKNREM